MIPPAQGYRRVGRPGTAAPCGPDTGGRAAVIADTARRRSGWSAGEPQPHFPSRSRPSPSSDDLQAGDGFLNPVLERFFKQLALPNLLRKNDVHVLAGLVPKARLAPEVTAKLDAILAVARKARPNGE